VIAIEPMLATSGELPRSDDGWVYEFKWDGVRCIAETDQEGQISLLSRNRNDFTVSFPEVHPIASELPPNTVLDGELVVLDEDRRPNFGLLQHRLHVVDPHQVSSLVGTHPVNYFVFDVLGLDGHDLCGLPWHERRRVLDSMELSGSSWRVPPFFEGDGQATLEAAESLKLEGLVAKRRDGVYWPGRRSPSWQKVKLVRTDGFVVGGFSEGSGRRSGVVGSLMLGAYDEGRFRYVGSVGSGLSDAEAQLFKDHLGALVVDADPFEIGPDRPAGRFVRPELVVQVKYHQWTNSLVLRHPSYIGRGTDRLADDVQLPL